MSLDAMLWAIKDAPLANAEEHAILSVMSDPADESGCGSLLGTATIAERARVDARTAQRRIDDMVSRGILALGDQSLAEYIRADRRPVVYDLMIPYAWFGNIDRVNRARVLKDLPPLTRESRPDIAPAPPKKRRADAGKPRAAAPHGPTTSHPVARHGVTTSQAADGVTSSHPVPKTGYGVTSNSARPDYKSPRSTARGDYKSPEPAFEPRTKTSSSSRAVTPPQPKEEEVTKPESIKTTGVAGSILDGVLKRSLPDQSRAPKGRQRDRLIGKLAGALDAGWDPFALSSAIDDPLDGARSVFAVLVARLDGLGAPMDRAAAGSGGRPAHCGHCPEGSRRLVTADGGDGGPCPRCHPSVIGKH